MELVPSERRGSNSDTDNSDYSDDVFRLGGAVKSTKLFGIKNAPPPII